MASRETNIETPFEKPVRYEIINPSDPCHLAAPSFFIAAIVISILGTGSYGGKPMDDDSAPEVPLLMFGADSWCQQQFGLSYGEALKCAVESHQTDLVTCLRSVSYPAGHERTSLNDIVGRAHMIANNVAEIEARS